MALTGYGKAIARGFVPGLWLAPLLGGPAHAECFDGCGYDTLIWIVLLGGSALLLLIAFLMVKSGIGWLIKWIVGAAVVVAILPPVVISLLHGQKQRTFERHDLVGPLPLMAERTPIVLYGNSLFNCPDFLEDYMKARAPEGVLAVAMWQVDDIDFTQPVAWTDLPLELHAGGERAVRDKAYAGPHKGYNYHVRKLTPDQKPAAVAGIDYVIVAQCHDSGALFEAFRGNPALEGDQERYRVELAMAPLQAGTGSLSVRDLRFDLLDLRYLGETRGFLFAGTRVGGGNTVPYDPVLLDQALCMQADGSRLPGCQN